MLKPLMSTGLVDAHTFVLFGHSKNTPLQFVVSALGFAEVESSFEGCYADSLFDRVFTDHLISLSALTLPVRNGCVCWLECFYFYVVSGVRTGGRVGGNMIV